MEAILPADKNDPTRHANEISANSSSGDLVAHGFVESQPSSVAELSPGILARYCCDSGSINMAGCSIDDVPIFLVHQIVRADDSSNQETEFYVDADGKPLSNEFAESLNLDNAVETKTLPNHIRPSAFEQIWNAARTKIESLEASQTQRTIQQVIWCKYATGKVGIRCGDSHAQIAFHGWTLRLKNGSDLPPPFECEVSGKSSYEIVADDEQRITVPDAIERCAVTGRNIVGSILVASAYSGARAMPEYIVRCVVTGDALLNSEPVSCQFCEQPVSPAAILRKQCAGCAKIPRASDALLEKYKTVIPDGANSTSIRESHSRVFIGAKSGRTKHLIVLDRESNEMLLHKQKSGWFGKWLRI